jgi:hypothetical protein
MTAVKKFVPPATPTRWAINILINKYEGSFPGIFIIFFASAEVNSKPNESSLTDNNERGCRQLDLLVESFATGVAETEYRWMRFWTDRMSKTRVGLIHMSSIDIRNCLHQSSYHRNVYAIHEIIPRIMANVVISSPAKISRTTSNVTAFTHGISY